MAFARPWRTKKQSVFTPSDEGGGRQIELTATEYNLLHLFMSHPRQVLDRQTILNRVWGYDFLGETNIIEVYVRYLREKIEDSPSSPRLIQTVRGVGYVLKG